MTTPSRTPSGPIPFLDLARLHESIRPQLDAAIDRVLRSASFVGGNEVRTFEEEFGAAHGLGRGAGCGSGTDALVLTLRALGIGPGDEVVVPSMTFVATVEAVVHAGATPVVADVDPLTLLLDDVSVDAVRNRRTRAVIAVHLYGHVVPFAQLRRWREPGLVVIEDAAEAHLATEQGRPVGIDSHAACFSFYPGKNLGALGDGGMVISSDDALLDEVRRIRDHGRTTKYSHEVVGWCSRLDGLQAAVLQVKLGHLDAWTERRRALAARYRQNAGALRLVPWDAGAVHHLLVGRVDHRDDVVRSLSAAGIGTGIHYPEPLSIQPWLAVAGARRAAHAELAAQQVLSLPMDPLMTEDEVDVVCEHLAGSLVG